MFFSIVIILIWIIYTFIVKMKQKENFRFHKSLLSLVIFSLIASIALGFNYVASTIPTINDGIGIHNFLAYWFIGHENWSYDLFYKYFNFSLIANLILLIVYSILRIIED